MAINVTMHRLFVALRPPPDIRLLLAGTMEGVPSARWQHDEQLHLTIRYIGEVDRHLAEEVAATLARVHAPAPDVAITGVGQFAHKGRTDTLWAGVSPTGPLAALHRKVDHAFVHIGLPAEHRAYRPHITLARLARSAGAGPELDRWLAAQALLSSRLFALTHLVLYESHLDPGGARYEPVARWPLASVAATKE